eukprot:3331839-Amphidinium_carterae.1
MKCTSLKNYSRQPLLSHDWHSPPIANRIEGAFKVIKKDNELLHYREGLIAQEVDASPAQPLTSQLFAMRR